MIHTGLQALAIAWVNSLNYFMMCKEKYLLRNKFCFDLSLLYLRSLWSSLKAISDTGLELRERAELGWESFSHKMKNAVKKKGGKKKNSPELL